MPEGPRLSWPSAAASHSALAWNTTPDIFRPTTEAFGSAPAASSRATAAASPSAAALTSLPASRSPPPLASSGSGAAPAARRGSATTARSRAATSPWPFASASSRPVLPLLSLIPTSQPARTSTSAHSGWLFPQA
jgi:hypothetical protein